MCMIHTLLGNRRIFVELRGKISRWRPQRNGIPQGSVLAPLLRLQRIHINDQPVHPGSCSFVYADDLAVTTQSTDFAPIEETLTSALDSTAPQTSFVRIRQRRKSASSTRGIANVANSSTSAGGVNLTHSNLPVYLSVTLDRTLSYKAHIEKIKKKVGTRNNIIRK